MSDPRAWDETLVDGVRSRNESAFASVYRLLASDLTSFANGMLHDRGAAEDAVQQAFLELARAAPTFRGDTRSLRAWLYRSVRFSCLDELRRRKRRPEQPTDALPERGVRDPDLGGDPELQEALLRLNERHRSILVLRHVIGCSIDDIAHILGTSRTAVYAASARAERRLQRELSVESRRYPASQSEEADRQSGDGQ